MKDKSKGTDKTSINDWLDDIIEIDGQPEQAFLVSKAGSDPKYNKNMITYLTDNFKITIPAANELTYVGKKDLHERGMKMRAYILYFNQSDEQKFCRR